MGSHIIHCAEPYARNVSDPALVIEANHTGITARYSSDEPDIAPNHLIATNHHCKLYEPVWCSRYSTLLEAMIQDPLVSTTRAWNLEDSVSTWISVMQILIRPDNRDFWFAYGENLGGSLDQSTYYKLDELF